MVVAAYSAIMGKRKLKTSETQNSQKSGEDNKLVALEQKLDKLLDTVAVMEGRIDQQEQKSRLRELSPVPSAHSSLRIQKGDSDPKLPTFDELRSDDKIQAEVQRRLHQYDHTSRLEAKGKAADALKSGRFRPGVHKVKKFVNWPQDYCTVLGGNKQPTYDELNSFQWSQGYIQCVLEETDSSVKENMLKHFISAMQDAIELSFPTVRRAHGFILQEMERGNVNWLQPEKVEKIRSRNTQRVVQIPNGRAAESSEKTMLCKLYNKGTCRYEKQAEHTDKGITYQHFCTNCFANTGRKYDHPKHACLRLKNDKKEVQTSQKV